MRDTVAAVIVSFNPPPGLEQRLQVVLAQVERVYLVDNGSDPAALAAAEDLHEPRLTILRNPTNRGLGYALNQGLQAARREGAGWALLLDHDSTPMADMVAQLLQGWQQWPAREQVALLAPAIVYSPGEIPCRWVDSAGMASPLFCLRYARDSDQPQTVDFAISSGCLLRLDADAALGGMREEFFIDGIDTEYCLRARAAGWTVLAVPTARLHHYLGMPERKRLLGLFDAYPTHHSPPRHYYIARNRMLTARHYAGRFPAWMAFELASGLKLAIKVALYESQRRHKLWLTLRGTLDGLRGVGGPLR